MDFQKKKAQYLSAIKVFPEGFEALQLSHWVSSFFKSLHRFKPAVKAEVAAADLSWVSRHNRDYYSSRNDENLMTDLNTSVTEPVQTLPVNQSRALSLNQSKTGH